MFLRHPKRAIIPPPSAGEAQYVLPSMIHCGTVSEIADILKYYWQEKHMRIAERIFKSEKYM